LYFPSSERHRTISEHQQDENHFAIIGGGGKVDVGGPFGLTVVIAQDPDRLGALRSVRPQLQRHELVAAREALIDGIVGKMSDAHRRFLVSFKRGDPDWTLLGVPTAAGLPAVKWRQQNLDKLTKKKRTELVEALEKVLSAE
jgi:hypothetical protein